MAKKTTKKPAARKKTTSKAGGSSSKKTTSKKASAKKKTSGGKGLGFKAGVGKGKDLVIVESPSKAKTINKYLGPDYLVLASVGHVRDLPSKSEKGKKSPVPGVDLENRFQPTYTILSGKEGVIRDLKKAAKEVLDSGGKIWFATDLDREGEAIAWHLAQELGIEAKDAQRVIFPAITKTEIAKAFQHPHPIDEDRVNAQQARRILDRIVGYQVSPLLWKKVARGLSAGRVQSVAVRLVVEREREIRAFVPDETWSITGYFALDEASAPGLGEQWRAFMSKLNDKGAPPTLKAQNAWLGERSIVRAELVEFDGRKFEPKIDVSSILGDATDLSEDGIKARRAAADKAFASPEAHDLSAHVGEIARACGLVDPAISVSEDPEGRGPARWKRSIEGACRPSAYRVESIETKRTRSSPAAPFITSTMQQAASSRLGFGAQRTMRAAQGLYEGVDLPGEGPTGLITYMRTDSTHVAPEAIDAARAHIRTTYGDRYLPDEPRRYKSSNKDAQEAHEAIRPTDPTRTPDSVRRALKPDQFRLYELIWQRFVASQMTPAQWDSTQALIRGGEGNRALFRATGRRLVFDGFYRVMGVPVSDELNLPELEKDRAMYPIALHPRQRFSSPPARYTEAGLIKVLESEGIGRPSTYASIIQTIQDRKYVEQIQRAFYATDLGEVVTDKLVEAFPRIMDVSYTRTMEGELDKVEEEHLDWIDMLEKFYARFSEALERAHEELGHAKAEIRPAPKEYRCGKCGSDLVYRFGKNGRFLSCSTYPDCNYACPCDREGRPMAAEFVDVRCPETGRPMIRRTGRFGPFIATMREDDEPTDFGTILNIDKKGHVVAPSIPPYETDLPCPICESPLNLRSGVRGPWLGCSRFPKCRGRGKWTELDEKVRARLSAALEAHEAKHPIPIITRLDGTPLTDAKGKPLPDAPTVDELVLDHDPRKAAPAAGAV